MTKSDVSEIKSLLWLIVFLLFTTNTAPWYIVSIAAAFVLYYTGRSLYEYKKGE